MGDGRSSTVQVGRRIRVLVGSSVLGLVTVGLCLFWVQGGGLVCLGLWQALRFGDGFG